MNELLDNAAKQLLEMRVILVEAKRNRSNATSNLERAEEVYTKQRESFHSLLCSTAVEIVDNKSPTSGEGE